MAVFQMGAVAMPLSMLFGPEALEYRLQDSDAVVAICDESSIDSLNAIRGNCPALAHGGGRRHGARQGRRGLRKRAGGAQGAFTAVKTKADEGAILIYTSGTTGPPKGALLPHRALIGNLPGFICSHNWFGFDGKTNKKSGRRVLVSGRLGLDRRADGCAAAQPVLRPAHRCLQRALQPRAGLQPDGRAGRDAHLFVPHGAQGHDEGLSRAQAAFQAEAAGHDERRRSGGRCRVQPTAGAAGRDRQRDVRPDRDELRRRQLQPACGPRAPAAWARPTRATAWR
jgi:acyl-CoA synthetase (AMP-forming)/AMP-acid ligase II